MKLLRLLSMDALQEEGNETGIMFIFIGLSVTMHLFAYTSTSNLICLRETTLFITGNGHH